MFFKGTAKAVRLQVVLRRPCLSFLWVLPYSSLYLYVYVWFSVISHRSWFKINCSSWWLSQRYLLTNMLLFTQTLSLVVGHWSLQCCISARLAETPLLNHLVLSVSPWNCATLAQWQCRLHNQDPRDVKWASKEPLSFSIYRPPQNFIQNWRLLVTSCQIEWNAKFLPNSLVNVQNF